MQHYFITIAGNIGVGKSTLTRLLTDKTGFEPVYEPHADNPYLADFYDDMDRWSFHSQVFFLTRRLRQHHDLLRRPNSVLQDRSVYEDAEIFARNLFNQGAMSERDWRSYHDLYSTLTTILAPPHLVVYLKASVETLRSRIEQRGREYERGISADYLHQLNELYDEWAFNFSLSPVLVIETDNLNYIRYDEHLDLIWERVEQRLRGLDVLTL